MTSVRSKLSSKSYILSLVLTFILLLHVSIVDADAIPVHAEYYPDRENETLIDPDKLLDASEADQIAFIDSVSELQHEYVLVVLDHIEQNGSLYAQQLFEHYALGEQSVLFVLVLDEEFSVYYHYGSQLIELGYTDSLMDISINRYESQLQNDRYLEGMQKIIETIENDLLEKIERQDNLLATNSSVAGFDTATASPAAVATDESGMSLFMKIVIIIASILIVGLLMILYKKLILREVDRLEAWKNDLEGRSFTSEFARVKNLPETESLDHQYEKWKSEWKYILNTTLPYMEEMLIHIDDYAFSYRFIKCHQLIKETKDKLNHVEDSLQAIIDQIDELTFSEEHNRDQYINLSVTYEKLCNDLHDHSVDLGIAYPVLQERVKKLDTWFEQYDQAQQGGNYEQAKDTLAEIEQDLNDLHVVIKEMPELIHDIDYVIPNQLKELHQAISEMKEQRYLIEETGVEKQIETFEELKNKMVVFIENSQMDELRQWKEQAVLAIDKMFEKLEQEVNDRAYVHTHVGGLSDQRAKLQQLYDRLYTDTKKIKQYYKWDGDLDEQYQKIKNRFEQMNKNYANCHVEQDELHEKYREIKPHLERFQEDFEFLCEQMEAFQKELQAFNDEERHAQETAEELRLKLVRLQSSLRKSNLPGLPEYIKSSVAMADQSLSELEKNLNQDPVDMSRVQHQLKEALSQSEVAEENAENIIGLAAKSEFMIQYANRYRRTDLEVQDILEAAEQSFRRYEYRDALEFVEEALDLSDRNWREKVDIDNLSVS